MRNVFFWRGKWTEDCLYSMVREEWKEPKILTKTVEGE
jgi:RimJ/RimL family protein N-acetyltransferase